METVNVILKLLSLLGITVAVIELLPKEKQKRLDNYIRKKLNVKSYLTSLAVFAVTIIIVSLYLNFAGQVMFYIIGIGFILIGIVINLSYANFDNFLDGVIGEYLGKIVFLIILYALAFISWAIPFEHLFFVFYPYEQLTALFSETPVLSVIFPHFNSAEFYHSFKEMSDGFAQSIFKDAEREWYFYIMPGWIFFQSTSLFSFLTILLAEVLFFISLFRLVAFSITSLYFPIFQLADYIKKKSDLEKSSIPIMGILITIISSVIGLFI